MGVVYLTRLRLLGLLLGGRSTKLSATGRRRRRKRKRRRRGVDRGGRSVIGTKECFNSG